MAINQIASGRMATGHIRLADFQLIQPRLEKSGPAEMRIASLIESWPAESRLAKLRIDQSRLSLEKSRPTGPRLAQWKIAINPTTTNQIATSPMPIAKSRIIQSRPAGPVPTKLGPAEFRLVDSSHDGLSVTSRLAFQPNCY